LKKLALTGLAGLLMLAGASAAPAQTGVISAGTPVSGTFTLALTITVLSPTISTSTPIRCTLVANVTGAGATGLADSITDSATAGATRTGSTAKCEMTLPYKWTLSGATDTIILSYNISATSSTTGEGRNISVFIKTLTSVPPTGAKTRLGSLTAFI
jgi:hypothetical protein